MTLIQVPDITQPADSQAPAAIAEPERRDAAFWLALEEWVARSRGSEECFFTWQVGPTAIYGRHQVVANEVDLEFCGRHGIGLMRRRSGGGCIYADGGNMMFSYVVNTPHDVPSSFARATAMTVDTLRNLGIAASASGRNDITLDHGGGKVCGYAVYHLMGTPRTIVHGTTLLARTGDWMQQVLTPDADKLARHGVKSVSQRVDYLTNHLPGLTPEALAAAAASRCSDVYTLTSADLAEVAEIAARYRRPEWIMRGEHIENQY